MKLSDAERYAVSELADRLREEVGATEVLLYGSAARDELEEGSDIDLFVVVPDLDWDMEKKVVDFCFQAELEYGRVFSAACFSAAELAEGPLRSSPFVLNARRDCIGL